MDPKFKKFKVDGHFFLWKYLDNRRNYPGWNITFDQTACDSILLLLNTMAEAEFSSEVFLSVSKPTPEHLQIANRGSRTQSVSHLILRHKKTFDKGWSLEHLKEDLSLTFDTNHLKLLKDAIFKVKHKEGDFAICDKSESDESILTFW